MVVTDLVSTGGQTQSQTGWVCAALTRGAGLNSSAVDAAAVLNKADRDPEAEFFWNKLPDT